MRGAGRATAAPFPPTDAMCAGHKEIVSVPRDQMLAIFRAAHALPRGLQGWSVGRVSLRKSTWRARVPFGHTTHTMRHTRRRDRHRRWCGNGLVPLWELLNDRQRSSLHILRHCFFYLIEIECLVKRFEEIHCGTRGQLQTFKGNAHSRLRQAAMPKFSCAVQLLNMFNSEQLGTIRGRWLRSRTRRVHWGHLARDRNWASVTMVARGPCP